MEGGGQQHFLPIAAETGSRLRIREWVEILLDEKERVGLTMGFMFQKKGWDAHQGYLFCGSVSGEVGVDPAKHFRNHPINYQLVGEIWGKEIHAERGNKGGSERWH
jgi:hypothetical protein